MCPSVGDTILGAGSATGHPIFFTRKQGLVAVHPRETISVLPEDIEESLASSVAEPNDEVIFATWNIKGGGIEGVLSLFSYPS